ncbi:MAG: glycosyltransferase [Hydrogenophilales bacterium]|nr:glycosyltransferase [Hydrogenophilales bacterium]
MMERHGKSLRITMLTTSLSRTGGGVYGAVLGLSSALIGLGVPISLVGLSDRYTDADIPSKLECQLSAAQGFGDRGLRFAPGLGRALALVGGDLVHLHGLWTQPSLTLAAWRRRTGRPTIISPHGMLDPWALKHSRWKKRLAEFAFERSNLSAASCLHALNDAEAEAIRRFGLTNPVAVIPNGVELPDIEVSSGGANDGERIRQLLFLGRLHPKKGLEETIRAWALLRERAPAIFSNWRLVVAGWDDGGHSERLRAVATELGLGNNVVFPGSLFGVAKEQALREASGFILASHSEGLPMAVLEAWSYSLPVFMTPACNLPEGFAADAAIEIRPLPEMLAQTLAENLSRADLGVFGRRGRQLVEQRFSWDSVARRHAAVHAWLVGSGPKPDDVRLA